MGLGMTGAACRHRYTKYRKAHPSPVYDAVEVRTPFLRSDDGGLTFERDRTPQEAKPAQIETAVEVDGVPLTVDHVDYQTREKNLMCVLEKPHGSPLYLGKTLFTQKTEEPPTNRKSRTVEKTTPLDPSTLAEIDRLLGEGVSVLDIAAEFEKKGQLVPWTKIRSRAAQLGRQKKTATREENVSPVQPDTSSVSQDPDDRPEPVSISRAELDLRIWDMWKAGKTLDEISDILYAQGLYYSSKSVRVRLLQQGAKL
jgi:hypothetical protein